MLTDKHQESLGTGGMIIKNHFVVQGQERIAISGLLQNVGKVVIQFGLASISLGGIPLPVYCHIDGLFGSHIGRPTRHSILQCHTDVSSLMSPH
jgi:hypothetical protein